MQNSLKFLVVYLSQIACSTFGGNIIDSVGSVHLMGIGRASVEGRPVEGRQRRKVESFLFLNPIYIPLQTDVKMQSLVYYKYKRCSW